MKYNSKLEKLIPGGAHTYSRGNDQFSKNTPEIFQKGKGAYLYTKKGKKFLDYGMGLRSVLIGYSVNEINNAAIDQIRNGNNLTRPSEIELKAAKIFTKIIKSADMVKFTKNGSTAVTGAIKLARAYTGKNYILRCSNHPFFSYDDWFIGSTNVKRGIPKQIQSLTKTFLYNNIESLKKLIKKFKKNIACVVLEPSNSECPKLSNQTFSDCCGCSPCSRDYTKNHFLKEVQNLCNENKIVFILDEMITGFRWDYNGAQSLYNINPDLSTFGKAMANGFPLSAVCGKEEIMELGGINKKGQERVFFLSTTFGSEMSSLGAFVKTVEILKKKKVIENVWSYGNKLKKIFNEISESYQMEKFLYADGIACSPKYNCLEYNSRKESLALRTILMQEMIKNNVLLPGSISLSYSHSDKELKLTKIALEKAMHVYKKALTGNPKNYLIGEPIKPVFRKFN